MDGRVDGRMNGRVDGRVNWRMDEMVVGGWWEDGRRIVGGWWEGGWDDGCRVYAGKSSVSSWSGTRTPELHSTQ